MKDIEYQGAQLELQKAAILSVPLEEEEMEDEESTPAEIKVEDVPAADASSEVASQEA